MGEQPLAGTATFLFLQNWVVNVSARLTDKVKKQIIADRVEGLSIRKIAAKYNVSRYAVELAIKSDPAFSQKMTQKKEENTLDMLAYMEGQKGKLQTLLTHIAEAMDDPEKLKRTNPRDLATAYGIIVDKIIAAAPKQTDEYLQKAKEILGSAPSVIE